MSAVRLIHVDDSLSGISRAAQYLSRYESGFLTYLERVPDAAALLRSV